MQSIRCLPSKLLPKLRAMAASKKDDTVSLYKAAHASTMIAAAPGVPEIEVQPCKFCTSHCVACISPYSAELQALAVCAVKAIYV